MKGMTLCPSPFEKYIDTFYHSRLGEGKNHVIQVKQSKWLSLTLKTFVFHQTRRRCVGGRKLRMDKLLKGPKSKFLFLITYKKWCVPGLSTRYSFMRRKPRRVRVISDGMKRKRKRKEQEKETEKEKGNPFLFFREKKNGKWNSLSQIVCSALKVSHKSMMGFNHSSYILQGKRVDFFLLMVFNKKVRNDEIDKPLC